MRSRQLIRLLILIFALSGFSGLIYESIWTHYLKLFLGHAAYAQTLVLAIFMGGMASGSWFSARYGPRWSNLLRGYAIAEGLIGLAALLFDPFFREFMALAFDRIIPQLGSPTQVTLFKWFSAAALILPQAVLLGMTFPLMSAGIIRRDPAAPGRTLAVLYFANSIGGAVGVLASGFLLIRTVGLPGTIRIAGAINILLAAVVLALAGRGRERSIPETAPVRSSDRGPGYYRLLLAVALLTGVASFIYEIGWIRMLSLVLGSSTHAFELMLSAFIFGLAFGGLWVRNRIDNNPQPLRFLATVQIVMGLLALATLPLYGRTFDFMAWMLHGLEQNETGYFLFNLGSHGIALVVMIPATFCAGMTLPLITYLLLRDGFGERSIGTVYAANTIGAIVGVFLAVHVGMAILGLKGLIAAGAGVDIAVGLILMDRACRKSEPKRTLAFAGVGLIALAGTLGFVDLDRLQMASGVFRGGSSGKPAEESLIESMDGKTATVAMTRSGNGSVTIRTNGKPDASVQMTAGMPPTMDEVSNVLMAAIPLMVHPQAKRVAIVGLGSGVTTHVLLGHTGLESVETIEIEKAMIEVARGFGAFNERAYSHRNGRTYIEDAKTFFSTQNRRYDIIISEPSNPWVSGVAGLFSEEYYDSIERYLAPNGVFVQWLQMYEIDLDLVASILKALSSEFDDYSVFAANYGDLVVVARNGAPIGRLESDVFDIPAMADALGRIGIGGVQDVEYKRVGGKRLYDPLLGFVDVRANSDFYPIVDQGAVRARFLGKNAQALAAVAVEPLPVLETLGEADRSWPHTSFTMNDHFGWPDRFFRSTLARDSAQLVSQSIFRSNDPRWIELSAQVGRMFEDCRVLPGHGDRVFVLLEIARATATYLRPTEMESILEQLAHDDCIAGLDAVGQQWLRLVQAVSRRDPGGMSDAGHRLLDLRQGLTEGRQKYLLGATMLGYIAQGKTDECSKVWTQAAPEAFSDSEPSFMFRLLAAHCGTDADNWFSLASSGRTRAP